jgi:uncharacterized membrane protein YvbJ
MAFCENCGKPVYRLDRTCANCGTPVTQFGQSAPSEAESSVRLNSDFSQSSPYTVLSTWGFVGSLLLMSIPFVGFILMIVWASGGVYNLNRRNLARGYLVLMGIGIGIYLILVAILVALDGSSYLLDAFKQSFR